MTTNLLTKPEIMAQALDVLAEELQCGDGMASTAIAEAAEHVRHLAKLKAWWDRAGGIAELSDLMDAIP